MVLGVRRRIRSRRRRACSRRRRACRPSSSPAGSRKWPASPRSRPGRRPRSRSRCGCCWPASWSPRCACVLRAKQLLCPTTQLLARRTGDCAAELALPTSLVPIATLTDRRRRRDAACSPGAREPAGRLDGMPPALDHGLTGSASGAARRRTTPTCGEAGPCRVTAYWPSRHNGGEYACTETLPGVQAGEPVDVVRPEAVGLAGAPHLGAYARRADRQDLLLETSLDDRDGAGGDVVVVPAGVVARGPAQQPDVDVRRRGAAARSGAARR